ncbi:MAG: hypothetical protein HOP07_13765 [Bacteriovoracaceae bacterium]|nr:hypothetical protein [Bacteriovoracaceae bacterium]
MHMTKDNNGSQNEYSFWSACLAMVTVFALLDVVSGDFIRESLFLKTGEYAVAFAFVIASIGAYASDGPPGLKFVRACSRHKL